MAKITKIEVQKRNKERVNIYLDEAYAFAISMDLVYKEGLKINQEIDKDKLEKVAKEENKLKCRNTALRIIERSYKTEKELMDRLLQKGYELEEINHTLDFMKEYKFINDESYLRMYIKDRIRTQGMQKIKYALLQKGINADKIEEALYMVDRDEEVEVARSLAIKKYNTIRRSESDNFKIWNKLCRFLVGRGYDYSLSKDIVKEVMDNKDME